jgi:hypothetical protein
MIVTVTVYLNAPYRNIVSTARLDAISVTKMRAINIISTIRILLHPRRQVFVYRCVFAPRVAVKSAAKTASGEAWTTWPGPTQLSMLQRRAFSIDNSTLFGTYHLSDGTALTSE